VCKKFNHYIDDPERRETGGTPNIIGCIKTGLVFQLKEELLPYILKRDRELCQLIHPVLEGTPGLHLIGPAHRLKVDQFPIYSFTIEGLHYNLVVVLLNDLFGIQTRGGVSCCSVYAEHLFHLCSQKRDKIYKQIVTNHGVPGDYGWCRVSFHYTMSDAVVRYILKAIAFVTKYGKSLAEQYTYNEEKNVWTHLKFTPVIPVLDYHAIGTEPDVRLTGKLLDLQFNQTMSKLKVKS
jgi:selenocysteine lyase/cysteine desulfurase